LRWESRRRWRKWEDRRRVGEGEGVRVGVEEDERVGRGELMGLVEEDEVVEEAISRYGRGGRVLKKPAKYT